MTSLFSSFDLMMLKSSFLIVMSLLFMCMCPLFLSSSLSLILEGVNNSLSMFFYSLKEDSFTKGISLLFFSFFTLIFVLNVCSLWPYIFSSTSQMSIILSMSLPLWGMVFIFQIINNFKYFVSHLIPEGTPIMLTWFLVAVEMISNLIRPMTLTVRLLANIVAGHLLMILLSSLIMVFSSGFFLYILLNVVEIFVSLIQSYIFCTMICLYFSEVS